MRTKEELMKDINATGTVGWQMPYILEVLIDIRDCIGNLNK